MLIAKDHEVPKAKTLSCCLNLVFGKIPQTELQMNNRNVFLTNIEAGPLRSGASMVRPWSRPQTMVGASSYFLVLLTSSLGPVFPRTITLIWEDFAFVNQLPLKIPLPNSIPLEVRVLK